MKTKNSGQTKDKRAARRSQSQNAPASGPGAARAPVAWLGPGKKEKLRTVRIFFPGAIVPLIDAAAAAEGMSREEFVMVAAQEKLDCMMGLREAPQLRTIWVSFPNWLLAAMDSARQREGLSREQFMDRALHYFLPAIERAADMATGKGGAR